MTPVPKISESEWEIMKIIWSDHPITAEHIAATLPDDIQWSEQTVRTFITRLLKKKAIGYNKEGRTYHYYPLVSEKECVKAESQSFLQRVFGGAADLMVTNFLEEAVLSEQEIEELQRILTEKKDRKGNTSTGDKG
ncbi:BlaI/MecI/CopY family transcriptional regulator [Paenibacillus agri]|uniref:BlaI/MecI/CopY family transcriptional regulator n=1 Tax=Paenibacillus agri TaxID=2744309 RepID=A0A850EIT1_9BACL|nr:BlaI/MecI/CopY family transcriptional regulator [Paenibacillus agri]NUU60975.1 BlaI/MecI/CopY family transcriptional regulator [Paenibacillus agri]